MDPTVSRSVSRDLDGSTDDGGGEDEAGRTKACTECKLVKASTDVRAPLLDQASRSTQLDTSQDVEPCVSITPDDCQPMTLGDKPGAQVIIRLTPGA